MLSITRTSSASSKPIPVTQLLKVIAIGSPGVLLLSRLRMVLNTTSRLVHLLCSTLIADNIVRANTLPAADVRGVLALTAVEAEAEVAAE